MSPPLLRNSNDFLSITVASNLEVLHCSTLSPSARLFFVQLQQWQVYLVV
jgi:hypothetical protein